MIYCRSMVHSYDVGTIFGPIFIQCIVRAMFVPCSDNVRTMAKKVRTMFVQSTTKVRTILYELLAIVRTLDEHCTNIVQTLYPESPKIVNLLRSLTYVNQNNRSNFVATS